VKAENEYVAIQESKDYTDDKRNVQRIEQCDVVLEEEKLIRPVQISPIQEYAEKLEAKERIAKVVEWKKEQDQKKRKKRYELQEKEKTDLKMAGKNHQVMKEQIQ
jgi:hypothetical protein